MRCGGLEYRVPSGTGMTKWICPNEECKQEVYDSFQRLDIDQYFKTKIATDEMEEVDRLLTCIEEKAGLTQKEVSKGLYVPNPWMFYYHKRKRPCEYSLLHLLRVYAGEDKSALSSLLSK